MVRIDLLGLCKQMEKKIFQFCRRREKKRKEMDVKISLPAHNWQIQLEGESETNSRSWRKKIWEKNDFYFSLAFEQSFAAAKMWSKSEIGLNKDSDGMECEESDRKNYVYSIYSHRVRFNANQNDLSLQSFVSFWHVGAHGMQKIGNKI